MAEPNILREVQLADVELPFRVLRGALAVWLLFRVLSGPAGSALSKPNLWLLFLMLGLRAAGVLMRRRMVPGVLLAIGLTVVGSLPYVVALGLGGPVATWLPYWVAVGAALGAGDTRSFRAIRDLYVHGSARR